MAFRITLVIVISTAAAYWHMQRILTDQHLAQLSSYLKERGDKEARTFELAESNLKVMVPRLLREFSQKYSGDVQQDFSRLFIKKADGTWRDRDPKINPTEEPTFYHGYHVPMDQTLKERLLISRNFIKSYGHAYESQFTDTYFTTPQNSILIFWSGVNWGKSAPSDLDMRKEEYIWVADKVHNPEREIKWTGIYFDVSAKIWMVSVEAPVYQGDEQIGTLGHDITLNALMDRTIKETLAGTKNFIIRNDGRLIAHPDYMSHIQSADGKLSVQSANSLANKEASLSQIYSQLIKNSPDGKTQRSHIFENGKSYFGSYMIEGPDWYFVVEYPKTLITSQAFQAAQFILFLGMFSLLVEIFILFIVLRKQVSKPLSEFVGVVNQVSKGDFSFNLQNSSSRTDEIGTLSAAFDAMLGAIKERDQTLKEYTHDLEAKVEQRTKELETQRSQVVANSKLASLGIMAGGIAHEINNPLAIIHGRASGLGRLAEKGKLTDESVLSAAEMIIKTSERIAGIVRGLKSFAREGSSDPIVPVDIKSVIEDSISICRDRINKCGIQLRICNPELARSGNEGGLVLLCRSVQITQVLVNLIGNSIDAIENSKNPWIEIRIEEDSEFGSIRVRDSGLGIPQHVREKLMTPFFTTKEVGKGTGLGLSISFGIAKDHGGRLYINHKSENTEFVLALKKKSGRVA